MPTRERNILIVVQNLPVPFDRRVWQEATSLRRAGFGVAVICPKSKVYTASYELHEDVDIYRYPLIYEGDRGVAGYFFEFVYCWVATLGLAIRAYAHRPFQVIHACNPPDTYFALALLFRPLGVKFVFDHHDLCPELYIAKGRPRSGPLYRGLLFLERLTLRAADVVIAVNQSHCDIALRRGGIDARKVAIVRSGPPCAWADVNHARPELKQGRRYLVIFLGVMGKQDGVDLLLRVIGEYRVTYGDDTLFALIGGGPERERMINMAQQMGLAGATHFTGRISNQELWTYLSTADLCVDPVPFTEWSNMSTMNKIIEYMAFGQPIVAFDLLEHRRSAEAAAVYVEPNDEAGLARAIRELLLDVERRHGMSQFARNRFRKVLAWENSEKQLLTAYKQLLDDEGCAPIMEHQY